MDVGAADRRGLIRESYRIEGISPGECRSIFLDWALGLSPDLDQRAAIEALIAHYGAARPDHPMTAVMRDGLLEPQTPRRRGGYRGRREGTD